MTRTTGTIGAAKTASKIVLIRSLGQPEQLRFEK